MTLPATRGVEAHRLGLHAEQAAADALVAEGWTLLARRLRAPRGLGAGEIDLVAHRDGLLAFIEVKARPTLQQASHTITARQKARTIAAAEAALATNPDWGPRWGRSGIRFDVILVDATGRIRRIADAWRAE